MRPGPSLVPGRPDAIALGCIAAATGMVLYVGWRAFWFLTDDAFIAFRYCSNALLGYGYTWNPPPFLPVEGYTSFSWVVILEAVWRATGIEPPQSANWIALGLSAVMLAVACLMVLRMRLPEEIAEYRVVLVAYVLAFALANRTFLAWTSSGLETALFNCMVTLWVAIAVSRTGVLARRLFLLSLVAALSYLTRPDGGLFLLATIAIAAYELRRLPRGTVRPAVWLALAPLVALPIHVLWRVVYYGAWLPNTYYAKVVAAWPEAGIRYLASFVLEYGLWVWLVAAALYAAALLRRGTRGVGSVERFPSFAVAVTALTLLAHVAYYTLVVGGDHFEYRVYSHLILFVPLSLLAIGARLEWRPTTVILVFCTQLLVSLPVPWIHWARTHNLVTREQTHVMIVPVADALPFGFRWYGRAFDVLQAWLIEHHVGMRHQEHKVFYQVQTAWYPPRLQGAQIPATDHPVLVQGSVGLPGWVLPHVAIIDYAGLNDYVVARNPTLAFPTIRYMAHDRYAPEGYLEEFLPNVEVLRAGEITLQPRETPLTAAQIIEIERRWREWARGQP